VCNNYKFEDDDENGTGRNEFQQIAVIERSRSFNDTVGEYFAMVHHGATPQESAGMFQPKGFAGLSMGHL